MTMQNNFIMMTSLKAFLTENYSFLLVNLVVFLLALTIRKELQEQNWIIRLVECLMAQRNVFFSTIQSLQ